MAYDGARAVSSLQDVRISQAEAALTTPYDPLQPLTAPCSPLQPLTAPCNPLQPLTAPYNPFQCVSRRLRRGSGVAAPVACARDGATTSTALTPY